MPSTMRASSLLAEVLVLGDPGATMRVSFAGEELLISFPVTPASRVSFTGEEVLFDGLPSTMRASSLLAEVLVLGDPGATVRVSFAGEEVLFEGAPSAVRASSLVAELLLLSNFRDGPGKLHTAFIQSSVLRDFGGLGPLSEAYVNALRTEVATRSSGQADLSDLEARALVQLVSLPSSILAWDAAVRAYLLLQQATVDSDDWLDPALPQSDLYVNSHRQELGTEAAYLPKDFAQSDLYVNSHRQELGTEAAYLPKDFAQSLAELRQTTQQTTVDSDGWRDPALPQSDLYVTTAQQGAGVEAVYLSGALPQSDLYASALGNTAGSLSDYLPKDLAQSLAELRQTTQQATVDSDDWLDPALPQSDLYVNSHRQELGTEAAYLPKDLAQSLAELRQTTQQATVDSDDWLDPALPQSAIDLTQLYVNVSLSTELPEFDSNVFVNSLRGDSAASADYPGRLIAQSELRVNELRLDQGLASEYPAAQNIQPDYRLHRTAAMASVPAGWLDDFVTSVRVYGFLRAITTPAPQGRYIDPADVSVPFELSYLTNCVGVSSDEGLGGAPEFQVTYLTNCVGVSTDEGLGGTSAAFADGLAQSVAIAVPFEDPNAPQSSVTVERIAVEVFGRDDSFGDFTPDPFAGQPFSSISLIFNDE